MFRKDLWIAALIGSAAAVVTFELCDYWLGRGFISRVVGVAILTVVLVMLVLIVSRRLAKRSKAGKAPSGGGDNPGA
ncbi:MAG: hypothetical protein ACYTG3_16130 [Planctomycetota bacterium]|jgi:ABC-type Fe3+ transport system permease subunit